MQFFKKFHIPAPGSQNESSHHDKNDESKKNDAATGKVNDTKDTDKKAKTIKSKLRDALQQWANDDARDIAEDDSTPLRSGL